MTAEQVGWVKKAMQKRKVRYATVWPPISTLPDFVFPESVSPSATSPPHSPSRMTPR